MAWNEPGKDNDPWGGRNNNDGPPDLDEVLKSVQKKLNGLFGGKNSGGSGSGKSGLGGGFIVAVLVLAAIVYGFAGVYVVDAKERAVVLRLGAFSEIKDSGVQWNAPILTRVFIENVTEERQYPTRGLMLTEDESIVELPITVQYNVVDVKAFVLNVRNPDVSLQHAADSALRHVVGSTGLNQVLGEGRGKIADEVKLRLQRYLDSYGTGIHVRSVNLQEGRPPEEVRDAFDDVIKAKEDQQRMINEAQAYSNEVIPEARGRAQRVLEEAEAYQAEVVAHAEGESQRFEKLLAEYQKAPEVTRSRLYLDTMESVMGSASKIMMDVEGGNNMMYLPLDKMVSQSAAAGGSVTITPEMMRTISEQVARQLNRSNTTSNVRRGAR